MRIDLHIHTTASDGTWTPAELIGQAQRCGLGAIAITDHGNMYGAIDFYKALKAPLKS